MAERLQGLIKEEMASPSSKIALICTEIMSSKPAVGNKRSAPGTSDNGPAAAERRSPAVDYQRPELRKLLRASWKLEHPDVVLHGALLQVLWSFRSAMPAYPSAICHTVASAGRPARSGLEKLDVKLPNSN